MDCDWSTLAEYLSARADETEAAHKAMMTRLRLYSGRRAPSATGVQQQKAVRKRKKPSGEVVRRSAKSCDNCHNRHRRCETPDGSREQACRECIRLKIACSFHSEEPVIE